MVLGAALGQLSFINICKKMGAEVIVVSIAGDYPGFVLADRSYYVDTRDKEKILEIANLHSVDAICTDQTDVSVMTVAYVAEKLGLRGIGTKVAEKFTNKYKMRIAARDAGIPVPDFRIAKTLVEAEMAGKEIGYPIIIKPVDSSGSRGVFKVTCLEDLKKKFTESIEFSFSRIVIIEKFLKGTEFLADGYAMNSEYCTLDIGEKEYFDFKEIFVSKFCAFSSTNRNLGHVYSKIEATNNAVIRAFELSFGITHAEYMYVPEEDNVYLIECAARGGGVFLSSDLTPMATGFHTNEALIKYLLDGEMIKVEKDRLLNKVSAWACFAFPDGQLKSINGIEEAKQIHGVERMILDGVTVGMQTKSLSNDSGKYGPILVKGDSVEECKNIIDQVKSKLFFEVLTNDGIRGAIW